VLNKETADLFNKSQINMAKPFNKFGDPNMLPARQQELLKMNSSFKLDNNNNLMARKSDLGVSSKKYKYFSPDIKFSRRNL